MPWIKVCEGSAIAVGSAHLTATEPPIAVFNVDGTFYAVDDTCTHGLSSLAEGYVEGCEVECIWHYARFDLRDGRAVSLPASVDLTSYPLKLEDGWVHIEVPDSVTVSS